jgi:hypothetical protein
MAMKDIKKEYHVRQEPDGEWEVSHFWDGEFAGNVYCKCEQSAILRAMEYASEGYTERKSRTPDRKEKKIHF